jgi:4-diphosphocytidyl-2-C-methyl-D-erythritol kinase
MRLRARAPAKINLCLFLGPQRDDGKHQLVTLFESVSLADELELTTRPVLEDEVSCGGLAGPNIVARALAELRARGWSAPGVDVRIDKQIPIAAGMGGGSADAAAVLRMAQRLAPMPDQLIDELAAQLGADVPSQIAPGLVLGTGAGDVVERMSPLPLHAFLILPSSHSLSTADVYAEADRLRLPRAATELAALAPEVRRTPQTLLINDLEHAAVSLCPEITRALAAARDAGCDQAFVCGSGPTVAAVYWGAGGRERAATAATALADRFPGATAAVPVQSDFGAPLFA